MWLSKYITKNGRNNFCRFGVLVELLYGGQNLNGCSIYVVKVIMFICEDGEIINTSNYV